jgi:NAD(P)-dependent dehydrogenase (short-subunit alcohol dehydrogenase family)
VSKKLTGKVALVTGGSRGIGAAIAKRLAADGGAVALSYTNSPQKADEVVRAIESAGGRTLAIRADNAEVEAVKNAVAETVKVFGRLDILVNNAGVVALVPIDEFKVQPGPVDTDMNPADGPFAAQVKGLIVLQRYAQSDEIAGMVSYLASPEAACVTGASLKIDGGFAA